MNFLLYCACITILSPAFLVTNLSDLARLAIVYKSGGFYSDSDILSQRSFGNNTNFIALEVC